MAEHYYLDINLLHKELALHGIRSVGSLLRQAGLHRNTLQKYVNHEREIIATPISKIAAALGIDPLRIVQVVDEDASHKRFEKELVRILTPLTTKSPEICFFLLGSRANGAPKKHSDWDIGLTGGRDQISTEDYLALKSQIEDQSEDFPFRVDVINLDAAPDWFLKELDYSPLYLAGNRESFGYILGILDGIRKIKAN